MLRLFFLSDARSTNELPSKESGPARTIRRSDASKTFAPSDSGERGGVAAAASLMTFPHVAAPIYIALFSLHARFCHSQS